jgi:hypothetical protein
MTAHDLEFDGPLTPEEEVEVARLTAKDIAVIDEALMSSVVQNWRKVARVVAQAMEQTEKQFPSVPDRFYAQRVMALRDAGVSGPFIETVQNWSFLV